MPVLSRDRKGKSSGKGDNLPAMTEAKMLGLPQEYPVGKLVLTMCAPIMREAKKVEAGIFGAFPDCLLFAAMSDRGGTGVDIEKTAEMYLHTHINGFQDRIDAWEDERPEADNLSAVAEWEKRKPKELDLGTLQKSIPGTVCAELDNARRNIEDYLPRICDAICPILATDCPFVWPPEMTTGEDGIPSRSPAKEGKTYLDDALLDNLQFVQFADLVRSCFSAIGGFPGDTAYRFLPSVDREKSS